MVDGVARYVGNAGVGQLVRDLATAALAGDELGSPQDPQVLGHERLARAERLDEFVHAARALGELFDHCQPNGRRQYPQQLPAAARRAAAPSVPSSVIAMHGH